MTEESKTETVTLSRLAYYILVAWLLSLGVFVIAPAMFGAILKGLGITFW